MIFSFLKKKKDINSLLQSIFKIAEEGMYKFDFPISNEGKFEIMMYDIWLGTELISLKRDIFIEWGQTHKNIIIYLQQAAKKLNLPPEKKVERIYFFREDGWKHDTIGFMKSDYPRTRQFLPEYIYLCFVKKPLIAFDEKNAMMQANEVSIGDLADFLVPFGEHHNWLILKYKKLGIV